MNISFRLVAIGENFFCNGNVYTKQSTRTAKLINNGRVFYFSQYEGCRV